MKKLLRQLLNRFPGVRNRLYILARRAGLADSSSTGYQCIRSDLVEQESERLRLSWKHENIPHRQRALVDRQLAAYRIGQTCDVFDVFVKAVEATGLREGTLLEVGCSSGYYAEVLAIRDSRLVYTGCDYSLAFIDLAKKKLPGLSFLVADARSLNFSNAAFDIVVSGCCLLHIPEFDRVIAETARVAKHWVIFHRTPVLRGLPNQYYRKIAYGIETLEIHFNEDQLLAHFALHSLETVQVYTLNERRLSSDIWLRDQTYLCRKISHD